MIGAYLEVYLLPPCITEHGVHQLPIDVQLVFLREGRPESIISHAQYKLTYYLGTTAADLDLARSSNGKVCEV